MIAYAIVWSAVTIVLSILGVFVNALPLIGQLFLLVLIFVWLVTTVQLLFTLKQSKIEEQEERRRIAEDSRLS